MALIFKTILLSLVTISSLTAQEWLQKGQIWEYELFGGFSGTEGDYTLEVVGDTIIAGIPCKDLAFGNPGWYSHRYAYVDNEAVFVYHLYMDIFVKIYDFSLAAQDTIRLLNKKKYRIDSIGTMNFNGKDLRFQHIYFYGNDGNEDWEHGPYLIIEGIGLVGKANNEAFIRCAYFFIEKNYCSSAFDGSDYLFQCFTQNEFTYDPENNCTETASIDTDSYDYYVYPNPSSDFLNISPTSKHNRLLHIEILDLFGNLIKSEPLIGDMINVHDLAPQNYIVKLTDQHNNQHISHIVIIR